MMPPQIASRQRNTLIVGSLCLLIGALAGFFFGASKGWHSPSVPSASSVAEAFKAFGCGTGQFDLAESSDYCVDKRAAEAAALKDGDRPN